jgi:hypothetical protein
MIHIATVHWQNELWIDIQQSYLKRHVPEAFRVYAFLNGIPETHRPKFHYSSVEPIRDHATKLNLLAHVIQSSADDRDILIFIDGDAFPIADMMPALRARLEAEPLVAVQRLENNGDRQPHPCFCATTVGFWKSIAGDWREGYAWLDRSGNPTTDVGGNLLGILERGKIAWTPLLRTNRKNLHPVWFGVYGDMVYHHGAGFRTDKLSRADLNQLSEASARLSPARRAAARWADRLLAKSPIRALRRHTALQKAIRRNALLSEEFMGRIRSDEEFYRLLLQ